MPLTTSFSLLSGHDRLLLSQDLSELRLNKIGFVFQTFNLLTVSVVVAVVEMDGNVPRNEGFGNRPVVFVVCCVVLCVEC